MIGRSPLPAAGYYPGTCPPATAGGSDSLLDIERCHKVSVFTLVNSVLKGRTTGGPSESGGMDPITYLLRAKKGQTMTLHLTSARKNAVFGVWTPGMDLVEGAQTVKDWSGPLPKTGEYQISVWPEDEKTNTTFTLEITVR